LTDSKNPFKSKVEVAQPTTTELPCLIPFVIWQEVGIEDQIEGEKNEITKEIKEAGTNLKDAILDTSARKECEMENGIFIQNVCHYYQVLNELCLKVNFDYDDNNQVSGIHYVDGCFGDGEAMKFTPAKVGSNYDFEKSINIQIRATQDPYMVLTYTRDNLGTDFRVFLYLAVFSFIGSFLALSIVSYYLCCFLKKKERESPFDAEDK
jgi:hypothetical protein